MLKMKCEKAFVHFFGVTGINCGHGM